MSTAQIPPNADHRIPLLRQVAAPQRAKQLQESARSLPLRDSGQSRATLGSVETATAVGMNILHLRPTPLDHSHRCLQKPSQPTLRLSHRSHPARRRFQDHNPENEDRTNKPGPWRGKNSDPNRHFAPASVHHHRNRRSRCPEPAFTIVGIRIIRRRGGHRSLAWPDAGRKAEEGACGGSGQQDGTNHLGHDGEGGKLQGTGNDKGRCCCSVGLGFRSVERRRVGEIKTRRRERKSFGWRPGRMDTSHGGSNW